jgi:hypothetical protein
LNPFSVVQQAQAVCRKTSFQMYTHRHIPDQL